MIKPKDKSVTQQDHDAARAHRNMKWAAVGIAISILALAAVITYALYIFVLVKI